MRAAAPLLAALAAAGCALLPPATPTGAVAGRLSLQVDAQADRPAQSISAAFELSGDAERGELRLNSPLGLTLATARWDGAAAHLVTTGGKQDFSDLDALSMAAFGEALPLRALPDWLRGRPWPGAGHQPRAPAGGAGFEQLGWTIDLARFDEGRLLAWRAGPPGVRLHAKLDMAP